MSKIVRAIKWRCPECRTTGMTDVYSHRRCKLMRRFCSTECEDADQVRRTLQIAARRARAKAMLSKFTPTGRLRSNIQGPPMQQIPRAPNQRPSRPAKWHTPKSGDRIRILPGPTNPPLFKHYTDHERPQMQPVRLPHRQLALLVSDALTILLGRMRGRIPGENKSPVPDLCKMRGPFESGQATFDRRNIQQRMLA